MRIIRFENTLFNPEPGIYNKVIVFDHVSCLINVFEIEPTNITSQHEADILLNKLLIDSNDAKVVFNSPVSDSYSFPFKIFLDITDNCQLNCKHCLTKYLNNKKSLSMTQLDGVIKECDEHGSFFVKLGGGEPLLHSNIREIIEKFNNIGMQVSLSTNGYLIDNDISKFLKDNNVKVSVSFEGPKELDEYIRGKGHFDVAMNALKLLSNNGCSTILRVTLTKYMLDKEQMLKMISIAKDCNVKLKVSYCRPAGNAIDNQLLIDYNDRKAYYEIIKLINNPKYSEIVTMDEGMQIFQDPELSKFIYNDRICGAANRSIHINSSGQLSPCVFLGDEYIEHGSNYQYGDIEKYWNESKGSKIRLVRNINMPNACAKCDRLCKYECLSTRLYFNNEFDKSDPNCLGGFERCRKQK